MKYLDFYEMSVEPFSNAPVSRFYFNSAPHSKALVRLTGILRRRLLPVDFDSSALSADLPTCQPGVQSAPSGDVFGDHVPRVPVVPIDGRVPCSGSWRQRVRVETQQPTCSAQVPWINLAVNGPHRPEMSQPSWQDLESARRHGLHRPGSKIP